MARGWPENQPWGPGSRDYVNLTLIVSTCKNGHECLEIIIDFTESGEVTITVYDYDNEMTWELTTKMRGQSASPVSNHLFEHQDSHKDLLTMHYLRSSIT